jgi:hypothetical protein
MKTLVLMAVLVFGIGCSTPKNQKIDITVTNSTSKKLKFTLRSAWLSKNQAVESRQYWYGWVDRRFIGNNLEIVIEEEEEEE